MLNKNIAVAAHLGNDLSFHHCKRIPLMNCDQTASDFLEALLKLAQAILGPTGITIDPYRLCRRMGHKKCAD